MYNLNYGHDCATDMNFDKIMRLCEYQWDCFEILWNNHIYNVKYIIV